MKEKVRSECTPAIGAVRIQFQSAHLKKPGLGSPLRPNSFIDISINDNHFIGRSTQIHDTFDPHWFPQTFYALVHSPHDVIVFSVFSHRQYWWTKLLGKASYPLYSLFEHDPCGLGISRKLHKRNQERGVVLFDLIFYQVVDSPIYGNEYGMGIVSLEIYEAKDLWSAGIGIDKLKPFVIVKTSLDDTGVQLTALGYLPNPWWKSHCEILAVEGKRTRLIIEVKNDRDDCLGHLFLPLIDVLDRNETGGRWWPLSGSSRGQLRLGIGWRELSGG